MTASSELKIGDKVIAKGNYWDEQLGEYAYTGFQTVTDTRKVDYSSGLQVKVSNERDDWIDSAWFSLIDGSFSSADFGTSGSSIAQELMSMGTQDPTTVMIPKEAFEKLAEAIEDYASFQVGVELAGEDI